MVDNRAQLNIAFALSGALTAVVSLLSDTSFLSGVPGREYFSVPMIFASALLVVTAMRRTARPVRGMFVWSIAFHLPSFYWLPDTLTFFGGFPKAISIILFLLFVLVSSIQFVLCGWLYRRLNAVLPEAAGLSLPIAWSVCEFLIPRLFPWAIAHGVIGWTDVALLASYLGVAPLAFLIFWSCEMLVRIPAWRTRNQQFVFGAFVAVVLVLGVLSSQRRSSLAADIASAPRLRIAMVQGNLSAKEKGNIQLLTANIARYRTLSEGAISRGSELVIWPESVMNVWTPEQIDGVRDMKYDPFPGNSVPLLYGGLSFRPRSKEEIGGVTGGTTRASESMLYKKFNTAFGIDSSGRILGRYHKRVLMPFGEYLPFSETFPSIREISPHSGDFTSGDLLEPIVFERNGEPISVGALICYEDLVPRLSRDAVQRGATLLVNLTNDAWYGRTAAPYQHHLLAAWRAIESGRYLLRSTNTGVTAIVDPEGTTSAMLPIFAEGVAENEVALLKGETFFVRYGEIASWALCLLCAVLLGIGKRRQVFTT